MRDVFQFIMELRKEGAGDLCSRPETLKDSEFNFMIFLTRTGADVVRALDRVSEKHAGDQKFETVQVKEPVASVSLAENNNLFPSPVEYQSQQTVSPEEILKQKPVFMQENIVTNSPEPPDIPIQAQPAEEEPAETAPSAPVQVSPRREQEPVRQERVPPPPREEKVEEKEEPEPAARPSAPKLLRPSAPSFPKKTLRPSVPGRPVKKPLSPNIAITSASTAAPQPPVAPQPVPEAVAEVRTREEMEKEEDTRRKKQELLNRLDPSSVPSKKKKKKLIHEEQKTDKVEPEIKEKPKAEEPAQEGRGRSFLDFVPWSVELPLNPSFNSKALHIGPHNRFAQAAVSTVIESPGMVYNPLLITGDSGNGKTMFVNIIASGLADYYSGEDSKLSGYDKLFVTTGLKLSSMVDAAVAQNRVKELEDIFFDEERIKALIIDDIHLIEVNDANRPFLAKLFSNFKENDKQIFATSCLPVHMLLGIEDALGFQITQGYNVTMKAPTAEHYHHIINRVMVANGIDLTDLEITGNLAREKVSLIEAEEDFKKIKRLGMYLGDESTTHGDLLEVLLGTKDGLPAQLTKDDIKEAEKWSLPEEVAWNRIGVFCSPGDAGAARFALYMISRQCEEYGINFVWQHVFTHEIKAIEPLAAVREMRARVLESGINGAVVVGPGTNAPLFDHERDFKNFGVKALKDFGVKYGWINYEVLTSPAAALRAVLGLI